MNVLSKITVTLLAIAALALTFLGCSSSDEGGGNDDLPPLDNGSEVPDGISSSSSSSSSAVIEKIYGEDLVYEFGGQTFTSKTVVIGVQTWMAENLRSQYGGTVFSWNEAIEACPSGWHLPDYDEWKELIDYVESENKCTDCAGKHLSGAGGVIGGVILDTYGFAAIWDGSHLFYSQSGFATSLIERFFWVASENNRMYLGISNSSAAHFEYDNAPESDMMTSKLNVRCVKD